jgi:hypothetical protein
VVLLHVVGGDGVSPPDEESLYETAETLLEVPQRRAVVLDLTRTSPTAKRRKKSFEWGKTNLERIVRVTACFAVVAPGAVQRGVITAARWFVEMPLPVEVFASTAPAFEWAAALAEREGLSGPLPRPLQAYVSG